MSFSRIISRGPSGTTWFHYDSATDEFHIETVQDVEAIVEETQEAYKNHDEKTPWKVPGMGYDVPIRVASIPLVIYHELMKKGIVGRGFEILDPKAFRAFLNDPDNRAFRVRPGHV